MGISRAVLVPGSPSVTNMLAPSGLTPTTPNGITPPISALSARRARLGRLGGQRSMDASLLHSTAGVPGSAAASRWSHLRSGYNFHSSSNSILHAANVARSGKVPAAGRLFQPHPQPRLNGGIGGAGAVISRRMEAACGGQQPLATSESPVSTASSIHPQAKLGTDEEDARSKTILERMVHSSYDLTSSESEARTSDPAVSLIQQTEGVPSTSSGSEQASRSAEEKGDKLTSIQRVVPASSSTERGGSESGCSAPVNQFPAKNLTSLPHSGRRAGGIEEDRGGCREGKSSVSNIAGNGNLSASGESTNNEDAASSSISAPAAPQKKTSLSSARSGHHPFLRSLALSTEEEDDEPSGNPMRDAHKLGPPQRRGENSAAESLSHETRCVGLPGSGTGAESEVKMATKAPLTSGKLAINSVRGTGPQGTPV